MGSNARNDSHVGEERWAGGEGHEEGSLDELRAMQAAGLGFTMAPIASTFIHNNRETIQLIHEVPIAHDSRREERCEDEGFMIKIVVDVVKEAGSLGASEGKILETVVREVLHALAARSISIPGGGGGSILLPACRFGGKTPEPNIDGDDWFRTTSQHLESEEEDQDGMRVAAYKGVGHGYQNC